MRAGPNRAYYLKKRAGGHTRPSRHHPRRRRIDVLWALLRNDRTFSIDPPSLAAAATASLRFPMARHRSIFYLGGTFR